MLRLLVLLEMLRLAELYLTVWLLLSCSFFLLLCCGIGWLALAYKCI